MRRRFETAVLAGALLNLDLAGGIVRGAPFFQGLGFLEPNSQSIAYAVTPDGNVAVGESIAPEGFEAFRWTQAGGMVGLGFLPNPGGFLSSQAKGASADGEVVVGISLQPGALLEDGSAMRWTAATGMTYLGNLGGSDQGGIAEGITPDGSVIVGWCASSAGIYQPFRWTQAAGMNGLGLIPGEQIGRAQAVSADGSIIVGNVSVNSTTNPQPFRWTQMTGIVLLPMLNPNTLGSANAITPDGSVIVGQSAGRAVRWIADSIQDLGTLPGGIPQGSYAAYGVSVDGSVVVGLGNFSALNETGEAFIWDAAHGMRRIQTVLVNEFGLTNLSGWSLFAARGVSADGKVMVGYGFDPSGYQEAWIASMRTTAPADFNADGHVDLSDAALLVGCMAGPGVMTPPSGCSISMFQTADLSGDVDVDVRDFAVLADSFTG